MKKNLRKIVFSSLPELIPYLIISPHHLILDYGDPLELVCQTNLLDPMNIQWSHNQQIIDHRNYLRNFSDRNLLRISKVNDEHAGVYQCFSNYSVDQQIILSMPVTVTIRRKRNFNVLTRNELNFLLFSSSRKSNSCCKCRSSFDSVMRN